MTIFLSILGCIVLYELGYHLGHRDGRRSVRPCSITRTIIVPVPMVERHREIVRGNRG